MKNLKNALAACASDILLIVGGTMVAVGTGMIYLPAGLIAGGVLIIAGVVLSGMDGGDSA